MAFSLLWIGSTAILRDGSYLGFRCRVQPRKCGLRLSCEKLENSGSSNPNYEKSMTWIARPMGRHDCSASLYCAAPGPSGDLLASLSRMPSGMRLPDPVGHYR